MQLIPHCRWITSLCVIRDDTFATRIHYSLRICDSFFMTVLTYYFLLVLHFIMNATVLIYTAYLGMHYSFVQKKDKNFPIDTHSLNIA